MHTVWVASYLDDDDSRRLLGVAETLAGAKQVASDHADEHGYPDRGEWESVPQPSWQPGMGSSGQAHSITMGGTEYTVELAAFTDGPGLQP
jgi:hypothetical protein